MNSKLLPLIAAIGLTSTTAFAEQAKPTFSAGISSFAVAHTIETPYEEVDLSFSGIQFTGAVNLTDQLQATVGFYSADEQEFDAAEMSGYSIKLNAGKGFQSKGLKLYGTFGFFNDEFTNKYQPGLEASANGVEFGAGIGYNFEVVSIDYGFTIRSSSDYETDEVMGSDTEVTTASAYLTLSANF